ncbi:hypothetical protein JOE61_004075 [Nocardioides salarius]|uniref:Phospholipase D-like domain-containing protein n=1 Tax=Nocardioides salarius TaxID=374513 RepID=A0ABS2MGF1_9ACTN|nr:hypothetical protein [Nocardioides salarius]MBM7510261.1 hypothetical protein [Nocardioides salarius]
MNDPAWSFPAGLNRSAVSSTNDAVFGLNVLDRLVSELEKAAALRRTERMWGPAAIGCAMFMDDPELIAVLEKMANACVVITKQPARNYDKPQAETLRQLSTTTGLAQRAFHELSEVAPLEHGRPLLIGPWSRDWDTHELGAVREVGFRKVGERLVPILHAKMMLLGHMYWTDEHPAGGVADIIGFRAERLWIGSANFTRSSRQSLEMGTWTTDPIMLRAARDWLLSLVAISEPFGTGPEEMRPELVEVEYDDDAMREAMASQAELDFDDD